MQNVTKKKKKFWKMFNTDMDLKFFEDTYTPAPLNF